MPRCINNTVYIHPLVITIVKTVKQLTPMGSPVSLFP